MSNNITNSDSFNARNAFEKTQNLNKKTEDLDQAKTPSAKPDETGLVDNSAIKPDIFIPKAKPDERGFIPGGPIDFTPFSPRTMNPFSVIYNNPSEAKLDLTDSNSGVLVNFDQGKASTEIKLGDRNSLVFASRGDDTLIAGAGADKLFGGAGNDKISGGAGNDILGGRIGTDVLTGGAGSDLFASHISFDAKKGVNTTITDWNKQDKISLSILPKDLQALKEAKNAQGESIAKLDAKGEVIGIDWNKVDSETKDGKTTFKLGQTQISFETKAGDSLQELKDSLNSKTQFKEINISPNRTGNQKNNILTGFGKNNVLDGFYGNDVLRSGNGNDTLTGGSGDDILLAGEGDDVINTGQGNDIIYTGGGKDTIKTQITTISQMNNLTPDSSIKVKDLKVGEDKISLELTAANKADLQKQGLIDANGQINWSKFPEPLVMVADDFKNKRSETTYTYQIGQTRISIVADKRFTPQEVFTLGNEPVPTERPIPTERPVPTEGPIPTRGPIPNPTITLSPIETPIPNPTITPGAL